MKEALLSILFSPNSGEALDLKDYACESGEIMSGRLISPSGMEFPITRGVPRFVRDEHYVKSFGLQWSRFRYTQLDSRSGTAQSRDAFMEKTG